MKKKFIRSFVIGTVMLSAVSFMFVPLTSVAAEHRLSEHTVALIKMLEAQIEVLKKKLAALQSNSQKSTVSSASTKKVTTAKTSSKSKSKSSKRSSGGGGSKLALHVPEQAPIASVSDSIAPATVVPNPPSIPSGEVKWRCDFEGSYCGFYEQSKVEPDERRSTFSTIAREGKQAIKLTTLPGDANVHGSSYWERNDLSLAPSASYCNAGQEEWWAMSVLFPDDYVLTKEGYAIMDFHHTGSSGNANFHFMSQPTGLRMHGFYGDDVRNAKEYKVELGAMEKNKWYDLVYHVKWSEGNDGFFTAWMNGRKVLSHSGPTLYTGMSCYLKLANYHDPVGKSSSVIFDRVIRGTSAPSVSLSALEGLE